MSAPPTVRVSNAALTLSVTSRSERWRCCRSPHILLLLLHHHHHHHLPPDPSLAAIRLFQHPFPFPFLSSISIIWLRTHILLDTLFQTRDHHFSDIDTAPTSDNSFITPLQRKSTIKSAPSSSEPPREASRRNDHRTYRRSQLRFLLTAPAHSTGHCTALRLDT